MALHEEDGVGDNSNEERPTSRPRWYRRRWLHVVAVLAVIALAAFVVATEWTLHHIQPIVRNRVIETLSEHFDAPVQLDTLDISLLKGAGVGVVVEGGGLRIPFSGDANRPPMIAIAHFSFRTTVRSLLHQPTHIDRVRVEGMELHIPPPAERSALFGVHEKTAPADPTQPRLKPRVALTVRQLDCADVHLFIESARPGREPLTFAISRLQMTDVGAHQAMLYDAVLTNPKPTGLIHASGHFGPWAGESEPRTTTDPNALPPDPGATPVDGDYTFDHADLNTIKGIGGILSSTGHFAGVLDRLTVDGDTDTPDFRLDISEHPVPLHTHFHAIVDGTNGDTYLQPVQARMLHSDFTCQGHVVNVKGQGHDIDLDVDIPHARMEDMLRLGVKTSPPLLNGVLTMKAKLHIPPGDRRVPDKMEMRGHFGIAAVRFNDPKMQDRIDGLSARAQGHPDQVAAVSQDRTAEVQSHLQAGFTLGHGLMSLSDVQYQIPGATVLLNGVYSMDGRVFEFKGHVRTEATASHMVSGWKSLLLKPVDRFLKKDGAGLQLPIEISGASASGVHFGLAMHGANDTPAEIAQDLHQKGQAQRAEKREDRLLREADREDALAAQDKTLEGASLHHRKAVEYRRQAGQAVNGTKP